MTAALTTRADAKQPYGPASEAHYADPGYQPDKVKRYPLDSPEHCRAAWSYINMAKNAAKYTPEQLANIKARIRAAGKKYGIDFAADNMMGGRSDEPDGEYRRDLPDMATRAFDFEAASGDGRTLEGYAAVFGSPARIADTRGDFDETIEPGAFRRSLEKRTPVLQWEHGKDPRVGAVPIGTIDTLQEDTRGLYVKARLFDNEVVRPIQQAIAGEAVKGMSFRFQVPDGGDAWPAMNRRSVRQANVYEVGPVVFPSYDQTSVSVRSLLSTFAPDERAALIRELAAEVRDFDFTGRPDARSAGGGDYGTREWAPSIPEHLQHRDRLLRMRGVLR